MGKTAIAAEVHLSLLGGFSATVDGQPVPRRWRLRKAKTREAARSRARASAAPRRRRGQTVAGYRAGCRSQQPVSARVRHPADAGRSIDHTQRRRGAALPAGGLTVDVDQFERAAATARSSSEITELQAALELWTGPLLPEDQYAGWAVDHRERLIETHAAVATLLGAKLLEQGEPETALVLLEPIGAQRPLDEHLHRVVMEALAELGRRWDAIESYERLRDALDDAYAAEPESQTKALYRRLLTGGKPMPATALHNLPGSTTSFVGRRRLLTELAASLGRTRLLTLAGVGGVGKSRLALELGRLASAGAEFGDGVWLVELAESKIQRSSRPQSHRPANHPAKRVARYDGTCGATHSRALLLIMDNCEHLLDACSALVQEVLARCPDINIVTTSRNLSPYPASWSIGCPRLNCRAELRSRSARCPDWRLCNCLWNGPGLPCLLSN